MLASTFLMLGGACGNSGNGEGVDNRAGASNGGESGSESQGGSSQAGSSSSNGGSPASAGAGADSVGGQNATGGSTDAGAGGARPDAGASGANGGEENAGAGGVNSSAGAGGAGDSGAGGEGGFDRAHAPSTLGAFTTQGSNGCTLTATTGARLLTLTVGGMNRTATVFVPPGYDSKQAYPIVFGFHGDGGTGSIIRTSLALEAPAAGKAIFAYPDGAGTTWAANVAGSNSDMDLVMAVRASLRAQYCVDMRRTFATGHSRGGFFVNQLACRYGIAEFAAIAPQSSTIDPGTGAAYIYGPPNPQGGPYMEGGIWDFACPSDGTPFPARPILPPPAMIIHGQCDNTGGVEYAEGRRAAEHWGYAAQCSTTPAVAKLANQTCNGGAITGDPCYVAPGCAPGHDVTFCAIPGMGHSIWKDAPTRIWSFFAAH